MTKLEVKGPVLWLAVAVILSGCAQLSGIVGQLGRVFPTDDIDLPPEVVDAVGVWAGSVWLKTKTVAEHPAGKENAENSLKQLVASLDVATCPAKPDDKAWKMIFIEDVAQNAIALPGGTVIVDTALLKVSRPEWIAVALGHEISHVCMRDFQKRIGKDLKAVLATAFVGGDLIERDVDPATTAAVMAAMGLSYEATVAAPFAREQESDADQAGLRLIAKAHIDPHRAIEFWEGRADRYKADDVKVKIPEFFRMHPPDDVRVSQLEGWLDDALEIYNSKRASAVTEDLRS